MDELIRIADYIVLYGRYVKIPGLYHGKAGLMLAMFLFSKRSGMSVYREFSEDLLDDIQKELSETLPYGMENGLAGIAYAMTYLSNCGLLSFDQNEVFSDLDNKIMATDLRRATDYSVKTGVAGLWVYVQERLRSEQALQSLDKEYIAELKSVVNNHCEPKIQPALTEMLEKPAFSESEYIDHSLGLYAGSAYYLLSHSLT